MVKITDGKTIRDVTKGMFDNLYSSMGYKLVEENKSELKSVKKEEAPVKEESSEKPKGEKEVKEISTKGFPKTSK